jgi:hypothetical protein
MPASRPLRERFWEKVDKQGPIGPYVDTPCWIWTATKDSCGYGRILGKHKKPIGAHRLSWSLQRGPIPSGLCVLHLCHNPGCVNPEHLYLGTQKDNARDKYRAGRSNHPAGPDHPRARFSGEDVFRILRMRESGEKLLTIAQAFSAPLPTIAAICLGNSWSNFDRSQFQPAQLKPGPAKGERVGGAKLTAQDVIQIRKLHRSGHSLRSIANLYPVTTYKNIHCITSGKSWKHIQFDEFP